MTATLLALALMLSTYAFLVQLGLSHPIYAVPKSIRDFLKGIFIPNPPHPVVLQPAV